MKTDAERKAAERERRDKAGLERFEAYVHPDDKPKVRRYIGRLNKKRQVNQSTGTKS